MDVEQVITKLLYLINQGETFTKVWILLTFFGFRFSALGFLVCRQCKNAAELGFREEIAFIMSHLWLWLDVYEQKEATEVFFAVTKLFQSKDIGLRRMVYLMIKEICPSSDEVIS